MNTLQYQYRQYTVTDLGYHKPHIKYTFADDNQSVSFNINLK